MTDPTLPELMADAARELQSSMTKSDDLTATGDDAKRVDEIEVEGPSTRAAKELWRFCHIGDAELTAGQLHKRFADRLVGTRGTTSR